MSALANHQMMAHVSRIAQLETVAMPRRSNTTTTAREKTTPPSRRRRAAHPSPRQISTSPGTDDGFWSPPASPVEELRAPQYNRVTTDIRISLRGPDPTLEANSEEFKKQAKEIKKDLQRLSRYTRRQHSNPATLTEYSRLSPSLSSSSSATRATRAATGPTKTTTQPQSWDLEALRRESEFRRRFAIQEGHDFLADFLRVHFADHLDLVTIRRGEGGYYGAGAACTKTLEEIKMIGNEDDVASGVRQCRRLFNAPVLSDRVGSLLYEELRQGEDLDHSHEWRRFITNDDDDDDDDYEEEDDDDDEYYNDDKLTVTPERRRRQKKKVAPEELRRRREYDFERSKAEYIEMRQLETTAPTRNNNNHNNTLCRRVPSSGQGTGPMPIPMPGRVTCHSSSSPLYLYPITATTTSVAASRSPFPTILPLPARRADGSTPPLSSDGAAAAAAAGVTTAKGGDDDEDDDEEGPPARDSCAGRNSVDSLLSEVKRRTFRGAGYIAASLAAGYQ